MTTVERIKRIANKAKVSYNTIKIIIYSVYGNTVTPADSVEKRLNTLEKQYEIQ